MKKTKAENNKHFVQTQNNVILSSLALYRFFIGNLSRRLTKLLPSISKLSQIYNQ